MSRLPLEATTSTLGEAWQWLLSAAAGALVTLVAFRTKLALMDRRIESRRREIIELEDKWDKRLKMMERRQILTLEILADIARKVGVDARFGDAVVQFLAQEGLSDRPVRDRHDTSEQESPR